MTLLPRKTSLHDIEDVEAFVIMCIRRSGAKVQQHEFEDMVSEGLALLFKLERMYVPRKDGYAQDGRFSGYAIKYMPRTIHRLWHQMQENHAYRKLGDGKRHWIEYVSPASFEAMTELGGEHSGLDETRIRTTGHYHDVPQK